MPSAQVAQWVTEVVKMRTMILSEFCWDKPLYPERLEKGVKITEIKATNLLDSPETCYLNIRICLGTLDASVHNSFVNSQIKPTLREPGMEELAKDFLLEQWGDRGRGVYILLYFKAMNGKPFQETVIKVVHELFRRWGIAMDPNLHEFKFTATQMICFDGPWMTREKYLQEWTQRRLIWGI